MRAVSMEVSVRAWGSVGVSSVRAPALRQCSTACATSHRGNPHWSQAARRSPPGSTGMPVPAGAKREDQCWARASSTPMPGPGSRWCSSCAGKPAGPSVLLSGDGESTTRMGGPAGGGPHPANGEDPAPARGIGTGRRLWGPFAARWRAADPLLAGLCGPLCVPGARRRDRRARIARPRGSRGGPCAGPQSPGRCYQPGRFRPLGVGSDSWPSPYPVQEGH